MITPSQCRAARALLDWSQQQLADASRAGNATIRNFESGRSSPVNATLEVLQRALESAGAMFIPSNGGAEGVRLGYAVRLHPLLMSGLGPIDRFRLLRTMGE